MPPDILRWLTGEHSSPGTVRSGKDHARIETRRCIASDVPTRWRAPDRDGGVFAQDRRKGHDRVQLCVSSLPPDAVHTAHAVRSYWRIGNSPHQAIDVAYGEDQCRVRVDNAAQNFTILRRIVMNLLKCDTTTKVALT
jgi:predicted transposase YbfD/YdcC